MDAGQLAYFMERVQMEPMSGCWLWVGPVSWNGYGECIRAGVRTRAHRDSYEHFVGPIPSGLQIDHLCRQRCCVNPEHLEPVTQRENVLRGEGLSAKRAAQTHCKYGHEFTYENTRITNLRQRKCRACNRNRLAARAARTIGAR